MSQFVWGSAPGGRLSAGELLSMTGLVSFPDVMAQRGRGTGYPAVVAALVLAVGLHDASAADAPGLKPIPASVQKATYARDIQPLIKKYCYSCHQGEMTKGGVVLDAYKDEASLAADRATWKKVFDNVNGDLMPPADKDPLEDAERELLLGWLETKILAVNCNGPKDPGRVTIRRLNRAEYNNTVKDLLGIDFKPADDFPADDVGYGFDNIGDVLTLPPLLFEKYLAAADKIVKAAIVDPDTKPGKIYLAREMQHTLGGSHGDGWNLNSNGEVFQEHEFPKNGEYEFVITAFGQQAGPDLPKMALRIDGKEAKDWTIKAKDDAPETVQTKVKVLAGKFKVAAAFTNDFYDKDNPDPRKRDRNLVVVKVEIKGPLGVADDNLPESHQRVIPMKVTAGNRATVAKTVIRNFASKAFRRPATDDEVSRLLALVTLAEKEGDSWERGIQLACQAVLVSPNFLFKVELDPESGKSTGPVYPISDYELATRLSYFLWSSLPDEELLQAAKSGTLRKFGTLDAQVKRMLKDERSQALIENFAGQWLQLRMLSQIKPDPKRFPNFTPELAADMRRETELFLAHIIREDKSIVDLLDANYTFLNERLAKHYGMSTVSGDEFRKVSLTDGKRGGLLGQASILTVTSNPTRTSPVKRGKWILENLLDSPPPAPPPGVPELDDAKQKLTGSLRQKMEQHRENPSCASCHQRMDPLGFGLENYDAIGGWRDKDEEFTIDASGELPGGETFKSPGELRAILKKRETEFRDCVTEKLLTYALGRGVEFEDQCTVSAISSAVAKQNNRFSALVLEIVRSDAFQKRRSAPSETPPAKGRK